MYPVMLDLRGRRVLIVGAGPIATRKAEGVLADGALVRVVAPAVCDEMLALKNANPNTITIDTRAYEVADLDGAWLVITATNDRTVQQQVYDDAVAACCWVNAADDPDRCAFILPAVHREGPVTVSVSTAGASPALAQALRDRMRACVPSDIAAIADELRERRATIKAAGGSTEAIDWRPIVDGLLDR